jgi:hypothetical protein
MRPVHSPDLALDTLMLSFESLGDNCEFGLVQRQAGAEPLGLLRFAGIFVPIEVRLQKLVRALERRFEGLAAPASLTVYPDGKDREFLVRESVYDLMYHTGISEGQIVPDTLRQREIQRLEFLRRKLLDDLRCGSKIWVWRSEATSTIEHVWPLLLALRAFGPNTLLWVVEGDAEHPSGMAEWLAPDLIKGYVERFAPYDDATNIRSASWFRMCRNAYVMRHINPTQHAGTIDPPASGRIATPKSLPGRIISEWQPGDTVELSGIYLARHDRDHLIAPGRHRVLEEEVMCRAGKQFPQCRECGAGTRFVLLRCVEPIEQKGLFVYSPAQHHSLSE